MRQPERCPYCSERVSSMGLRSIMAPPDVEDHTIESVTLRPCGHMFPAEDFERASEGYLETHLLGERVLNPGDNPQHETPLGA